MRCDGMHRARGFEHRDELVRLSGPECRNGRGGRAGGLRRAKRGKLRGIDSGAVLLGNPVGLRPVCGMHRAVGFEHRDELVRLSGPECRNGRGGRAGGLRRRQRGSLRGIDSGAVFTRQPQSACVPIAECTAPAALNTGTNLCDCRAPNIGTDGAAAPGDCVAASAGVCGGLTPPQFYDSALGACVAIADCLAPSVLNAGTNLCDCPSAECRNGRGGGAGRLRRARAKRGSLRGIDSGAVLRFGGGGMCRNCGMHRAGGFERGGELVRLPRSECWNGRGGGAGDLRRSQHGSLQGADSVAILRFGGGGNVSRLWNAPRRRFWTRGRTCAIAPRQISERTMRPRREIAPRPARQFARD